MIHHEKHDLARLLSPVGQTHLLRFWDRLPDDGRRRLGAQILAVDWGELETWIGRYVLVRPEADVPAGLGPAPFCPLVPRTSRETEFYAEARAHGEKLIGAGKVAGFTVAGGQGTWLGYDGPKGSYPISPVSGHSLFQLFAEGILRTQDKHGAVLRWYIMTSPANHEATRCFFEDHAFFGLESENVTFFSQGMLPAVGLDGKVLLAAPDSLALSPNGHGGSLLALRDSGALKAMSALGVEHISYWQVDNALVRTFDPLFIGLHDTTGSDMSSRCLMKTGPFERLGNFCLHNSQLHVIEYSDIPDDLATSVDEQGRLRFLAGSPAIHILRRDFAERLTHGGLALPIHRAEKKVQHVNAAGDHVDPDVPNAVKFETFIFDALPMARNPLILEACREEQFGPVKNPTGVDSAASSRQLMLSRAARWLELAGISVPRRSDGSPACRIELSPRHFVEVEDVQAATGRLPAPAVGDERVYR